MISKDNNDHRGTWNTYLCKNTLKDPVENEKRNREKKKKKHTNGKQNRGKNRIKWQDEKKKSLKMSKGKAGNKIK